MERAARPLSHLRRYKRIKWSKASAGAVSLRGAAEALSCPDRPTNARRAHRNSLNGALGGI